jgi:hypothetical protein
VYQTNIKTKWGLFWRLFVLRRHEEVEDDGRKVYEAKAFE